MSSVALGWFSDVQENHFVAGFTCQRAFTLQSEVWKMRAFNSQRRFDNMLVGSVIENEGCSWNSVYIR